jgi:hypothetical protein
MRALGTEEDQTMTDFELVRANERIAELESQLIQTRRQNADLQHNNNQLLERARAADRLVTALRNQAPLSSVFDGIDIPKLRQEAGL